MEGLELLPVPAPAADAVSGGPSTPTVVSEHAVLGVTVCVLAVTAIVGARKCVVCVVATGYRHFPPVGEGWV
jgi:hypothetical protein